jgi:hypothetical protein
MLTNDQCKELVGTKFGKLTVTKFLGRKIYRFYEVQCECGNKEKVMVDFLRAKKRSCVTCVRKEIQDKHDTVVGDLVGTKIGKLVVEKYAGRSGVSHCYVVRCECGKRERAYRSNLLQGAISRKRSCSKCANKKVHRRHQRLIHHLLNNLDTDVEVV